MRTALMSRLYGTNTTQQYIIRHSAYTHTANFAKVAEHNGFRRGQGPMRHTHTQRDKSVLQARSWRPVGQTSRANDGAFVYERPQK